MFMWHGLGEYRIDKTIFDQLNTDSDRAVGLVGAAILEHRLQEALSAHLVQDAKILGRTFDVRGPLGSFSSKIDMAYLLRLVTKNARNDLHHVRSIRNIFAHSMDHSSFAQQQIRNHCAEIKEIEGLVVDPGESADRRRAAVQILPDAEKTLSDPRKRFVLVCEVYSARLGITCRNAELGDPQWPAF